MTTPSVTGYVVLGLLSFGRELTGYELKGWADGSIRFFWAAPSMSQIYRELERLETAGLVASRDDAGAGARPRTVYDLTAAGREALADWVADGDHGEPVVRHPAALRLFLGHLVDRATLVRILDEHRAWCEAMVADIDEVRAALGDAEEWANARLVAEWGSRFYGADAAGAAEAGTRLAARRGGDTGSG